MMQSINNFSLPDREFPNLKRYGAYLLEHHLQEAAEVNIALARQTELPLLELFAHLSEQEFLSLVKESLETFFHQLTEQTALEHAKDTLLKWRKDTLPNIPRSGVATADLVLVYHVRKQLLLGFIDRYTSDVTEALAIARELDLFYALVEQFAFSLYVNLKEEEQGVVLLELQEKNNDLATALEELQAAEEQLIENNHELEGRVMERTGALAASEQQLRTITDALPGLITYIDREERYRFINKTFEDWFGIPRARAIGKKLAEVLTFHLGETRGAAAYDHIKAYIRRALAGEQLQYVSTHITKEGEPKHVLVNYVPQIVEGQVLGYYALFTDINERVEAELALKQSEARFSNIFNQSSVGMAEVDLSGRFVLVNDRYCQLVGRSREELYQIRMQDISHEGDLPQNMSLFRKAIETGTPFSIEKRYTRADKSQVWVRNNVSIVKDQQNQPVSVVAVCQDITQKKIAEQALQESKDLFQTFADNIQSLAWMSDHTGQILWYNQRWYDYTGTSYEEMVHQGWLKFLHPDHTNRVVAHVKSAREKKENWELTFPLRSADGEWCWFLARAFAIKDAEGNLIRWIGTSTDITGQVKAQEQLQKANEEIVDLLQRETDALEEAQQQKERLHNLFMQAPSLLCINRGEDFIYELANPSYLEVFMVDSSIIGRAALDVFPDADPAIVQIYTNVFETGKRFVGKELSITGDWKRNNSPYTRYFNLIYEPIRELDGTVSGIVTFGYEVSEHVSARQELEKNAILMQEMNQELNQKYLELSRINNDLDNFIYTASHDLRSPLINLEGLLLALNKHLKGSITPQATTVLHLANASIEKLKRTIKDLTEITKAQKGLDDVREAVSFKEILEDIKSDLPEDFNSLASFVREDFQVDSVLYSRAGLRTILYNLLSNAIKYKSVARPLEIRISTSKEDKYIILTVEDNGLGIPEQQLPKLFTMFTRLHTHVEGTGIGLYTIKRVIENNGGKIEVNSQLDKGSVFKVYMV
ncbi:PAS domain-containing protein [Flammeovirgaceae bacterium 311]|nr:PAS domain-containing protein [Flammeovirgaceae bacterium 311]